MPKVGFVSLGCPKNLVDSEVMMGVLARGGYEITARAADADVLVVNTCSFIESAQQESVNTILEMAAHKTGGRAKKLVVAGCLVERYRDEILRRIPEVDAVIGTGEIEKILEVCDGQLRPDDPHAADLPTLAEALRRLGQGAGDARAPAGTRSTPRGSSPPRSAWLTAASALSSLPSLRAGPPAD